MTTNTDTVFDQTTKLKKIISDLTPLIDDGQLLCLGLLTQARDLLSQTVAANEHDSN